MPTTTPTGIAVEPCAQCGRSHPVTRAHCPKCGIASLFSHDVHVNGGGGDA